MKGRDFLDSKTYLDLYNLIIVTINELNIRDEQQLLNALKSNGNFLQLKLTEQDLYVTLANSIDDGLVKGRYTFTTFGYVFVLRGLTSDGINYLKSINSNKIMSKIKKAIHEEGLPFTPNSISKILGKILF